MSRARLTDIVATVTVLVGFLLPEPWHRGMMGVGLFALSGALTNQLAIHMLFHTVPGLYGSGVIRRNFQSFKTAISEMVMEQFFTKQKLDSFFGSDGLDADLAAIVESADFDPAFDAMVESINESRFAQIFEMFRSKEIFESLRQTLTGRLKASVVSIVSSKPFQEQLAHHMRSGSFGDEFAKSIKGMIDQRVDELTPELVESILKKLIGEHLEWLVVWGGVFGAIFGAIFYLVVGI